MATRNSGYARLAADRYETPPWVTRALLDNVEFVPRVWEPAAGTGKMARVLTEAGHDVHTTDLFDLPGLDHVEDFRIAPMLPWPGRCAIITNPPFGKRGATAIKFIERALALTEKVNGQVAMLLPTDFDHGITRAHLFRDCSAFAGRVVLLHRIRWIEGSVGSPSQNFAWFHWNWLQRHPPTVRYAHNPDGGKVKAAPDPRQMTIFDVLPVPVSGS